MTSDIMLHAALFPGSTQINTHTHTVPASIHPQSLMDVSGKENIFAIVGFLSGDSSDCLMLLRGARFQLTDETICHIWATRVCLRVLFNCK